MSSPPHVLATRLVVVAMPIVLSHKVVALVQVVQMATQFVLAIVGVVLFAII